MCGRFNIIDDPGLHGLLKILGFDLQLPTRVNIAPTESVPVVLQSAQQYLIHEMRWWLTPSWAAQVSTQYSMFNARSDKISTSKAFRGPFLHKRGVMPGSSYIEWKREGKLKQPYLVKPMLQQQPAEAEGAFAFASIWDQWLQGEAKIESCAMITTQADKALSWLHHRMPVLLNAETLPEWLDPATPENRLHEILAQGRTQMLQAVPLNTVVNSGREKHETVLAPAGASVVINLS